MSKYLQLAFITTAVMLGFIYFVAPDCVLHASVCLDTNVQLAPMVYRILPQAVYALFKPSTPESILFVGITVQMACVAVIMPLLYRWLDYSIEGVMIFGVVWLMAMHFWWLNLTTSFEIVFVLVALTLIDRTWLWLIPITALASLNRETALLIPSIYFAYHGRNGLKPFFVLVAVWAGITTLIHVIVGVYPHELGLLGTLQFNLNNIYDAVIVNLLLLPLAIATMIGYNRTTSRFKRFAWVTLVYVGAIVIGGAWSESIRLVLPILPIVIPLMIV